MLTFKDQSVYTATIKTGFYPSTCLDKERAFPVNTVSLEIPIEHIKQAVRRLPEQEKVVLWRLLDKEIDRTALSRRFSSALKAIRKAYAHIPEDEVMADAVKATRQARKAHHAKSRS
jgi:hypothetical protein